MVLTKEDLVVGGLYRGHGYNPMCDNDRIIIWMDDRYVQYDSYTIRNGRNYPTVEIEKFLRWAKERVVKGDQK
jgi:hypothetical protein